MLFLWLCCASKLVSSLFILKGHLRLKVQQKNWPAPLKSSIVWQWLYKPWPWKELLLWLEVTQVGLSGWYKGSQYVFWPMVLLPHATFTKTVAWASIWPLSLALEGTHTCVPLCMCKHTKMCMRVDQGPPWESWPVIWQSLTIAVSRCLGSRAKQMDGPSGFG